MQSPLINGSYYSWSEIEIVLAAFGGLTFYTADFSAFDFGHTRERAMVRGTGGDILGRTSGEYGATGSMTMKLARFNDFQRGLQLLAAGGPIGLVPFDALIQWIPKSLTDFQIPVSAKLIGATLAGIQISNAMGTEETVAVCELSVVKLQLDGVDL